MGGGHEIIRAHSVGVAEMQIPPKATGRRTSTRSRGGPSHGRAELSNTRYSRSEIMGHMHWIVATLALGSLVLGSLALGSLAAGGSALAGGGGGGESGIGFTLAPGQHGTSPGKVFDAARASAEQEQQSTMALRPGETFSNYGHAQSGLSALRHSCVRLRTSHPPVRLSPKI
jgi:hypothetical protein